MGEESTEKQSTLRERGRENCTETSRIDELLRLGLPLPPAKLRGLNAIMSLKFASHESQEFLIREIAVAKIMNMKDVQLFSIHNHGYSVRE